MDGAAFEALSRETIASITSILHTKSQFFNTPQIDRSLSIEEVIYKRSNKYNGVPDTHNVWEKETTCALYKTFVMEMKENMANEEGPYWRRVEGGTITAKHLFDKFCKSSAKMPIPTKQKSPAKRKKTVSIYREYF